MFKSLLATLLVAGTMLVSGAAPAQTSKQVAAGPDTAAVAPALTTGFASWKVCKGKFSMLTYHGAVWLEPHGNTVDVWADNTRQGMEHYNRPVRDGAYENRGYNVPWSSTGNTVKFTASSGTSITVVLSGSSFKFSFVTANGIVNEGDGFCSQ